VPYPVPVGPPRVAAPRVGSVRHPGKRRKTAAVQDCLAPACACGRGAGFWSAPATLALSFPGVSELRHPRKPGRQACPHLASGIWHLASGIWHLASGIRHPASGIQPLQSAPPQRRPTLSQSGRPASQPHELGASGIRESGGRPPQSRTPRACLCVWPWRRLLECASNAGAFVSGRLRAPPSEKAGPASLRHLASGIWHPASGIRHLASGIWYPASPKRTAAAAPYPVPVGPPRAPVPRKAHLP
jgi:hypothetical protein